MKLFELEVKGELPSLNEIIAARGSRYTGAYNKMKIAHEGMIKWQLKQKCKDFKPIQEKVNIKLTWYTKDNKKDPDGIDVGIKFILDAFVEYGILINDTRRYIGDIWHTHKTRKGNPGVRIELFKSEEE